jgi:predicted short-subunit dehydrogenase-like oxidoreductase (DUF2520 family)
VKTLNVIGCGKVGKTLTRLWTANRVFRVQSVLNRSRQSAAEAVDFAGSGRPVDDFSQMHKADVVMISASDEAIRECCRRLCRAGLVDRRTVVFHLSGSLPSSLLEPAKAEGASIASVHPVKSFADPSAAVESFRGTFCALEGDADACEPLRDALERCGAIAFHVAPEHKTIYHAGTVFASNYLIALVEVGLRCFERAGLARETAMEVMRPIVTGTVDNLFRLGPARALTGPVARGEPSVVQGQSEALGRWDENTQRLYKSLARVAVELSAVQGKAGREALAAIERLVRQ